MAGLALTLALGLAAGGACGLLLASFVIALLEAAGRDDEEDR